MGFCISFVTKLAGKFCSIFIKSEALKKFFWSCCLIIWAVIGYKIVYMFHYLDLFKDPQQKNTVQFSVAWFSKIFKVVFIFYLRCHPVRDRNYKFWAIFHINIGMYFVFFKDLGKICSTKHSLFMYDSFFCLILLINIKKFLLKYLGGNLEYQIGLDRSAIFEHNSWKNVKIEENIWLPKKQIRNRNFESFLCWGL